MSSRRRRTALVVACIALGAIVGTLAGRGSAPRSAPTELARATQLRGEIAALRTRFTDLERDVGAVATPAAATAAREKLFQLRVDMAALEDELAELSRRTAVAR